MFKANRVNIRCYPSINSDAIPQINTKTSFLNTKLSEYTIKCSHNKNKSLKQTAERPPANLGASRLTVGTEAKHIKCFTVNTLE